MTQAGCAVSCAARPLATDSAALIDYLPRRARDGLPELRAALEFLHQPPVGTELATRAAGACTRRSAALALEELLAHQLSLMALRSRHQGRQRASSS